MARRFRRFLHSLVQYDALERRGRSVLLFFLAGVVSLVALSYIGVEASIAAELWFFILVRLLIGLVIAALILPFIWLLRRKLGLHKTPAGLLFLLLAVILTLLVLWWLSAAA